MISFPDSDYLGSTNCIDCQIGSYSAALGATSCVPCSKGTFQSQSGYSFCFDCASLEPPVPLCVSCNPDGSQEVISGFCLVENQCYQSNNTNGVIIYKTIINSGCQYCGEKNSYELTLSKDNIPCPQKGCSVDSEGNSFTHICSGGQCIQGPPCAPDCLVCKSEVAGCEVADNHCLTSGTACECMISGKCFPYTTEFSTYRNPDNICQISSIRNKIDMSRCTGSWVDDDDSNTNCFGSTACYFNQSCSKGRCLKYRYEKQPDPCILNYTCTGNQYEYDYTYLRPNDPRVVCMQRSAADPCVLPRYCRAGVPICPESSAYIHTSISFTGNLSIEGHVTGSHYVSIPFDIMLNGIPSLTSGCVNQEQEGVNCLKTFPPEAVESSSADCGGFLGTYYLVQDSADIEDICSTSWPITFNWSKTTALASQYSFWTKMSTNATESVFHVQQGPTDGTYVRSLAVMRPRNIPQVLASSSIQTIGGLVVCSLPAVVDNSPPKTGTLTIDNSPPYTSDGSIVDGIKNGSFVYWGLSNNSLLFNWNPADWSDEDTPLWYLQLQITRGRSVLCCTTEMISTSSASLQGRVSEVFERQPDGSELSAFMTAVNRAGLFSYGASIMILIDTSPPLTSPTQAFDCTTNNSATGFIVEYQEIKGCWLQQTFWDPQSGILVLETRIDTRPWNVVEDWANGIRCNLSASAVQAVFGQSEVCPCPGQCGCRDVCIKSGNQYRIAVRAVNRAGLASSWAYTNAVVVDQTAPLPGIVVHECNGFGILGTSQYVCDVQSNATAIQFGFYSFFDPESRTLSFSFEIGTNSLLGVFTPSISTVVQIPSGQNNISKNGLRLANSQIYFVRVSCTNNAGLKSQVLSSGVKIDLTKPNSSNALVHDVLNDCGTDEDFIASPKMLSLCVSGYFFDCESALRSQESNCLTGIESYQYGFGTVQNVDDLVPFSRPEPSQRTNMFHANISMLNLLREWVYYSMVRVCNRAGLCTVLSSNGFQVVFQPPKFGAVFDGLDRDMEESFQVANDVLCATWNVTDDLHVDEINEASWGECEQLRSNLLSAQFVSVGHNTSTCFRGLSLVVNTTYCVAVRSTNIAGTSPAVFSNGVMISGAPLAGYVTDGPATDVDFWAIRSYFDCSWCCFQAVGAHIVEYAVTLYNQSGVIHHQIVIEYGRTYRFDSLALLEGQICFVEVCAVNLVSQRGCGRSDGFLVDFSAPHSGRVVNGLKLDEHMSIQESNAIIRGTWDGFTDFESGIKSCDWSVGSQAGLANIMEAAVVGHLTWGMISQLLLNHGQSFYITVSCTNFAGLSYNQSSPRVVVHSKSPKLARVQLSPAVNVGSAYLSNGLIFTDAWHHLFLSWIIENDVPISMTVHFSVGTSPGRQNVLEYSLADNQKLMLLSFGPGQYYASLLLVDEFNRTDAQHLLPFVVDLSPPQVGIVLTRQFLAADVLFINVSWSEFVDPETDIIMYELGLGRSKSDTIIHSFQQVGLLRNGIIKGPFPPGSFFVNVRGTNRVGLSAVAYAPLTFDDSAPQIGLIMITSSGNLDSGFFNQNTTCHISQNEISVSWQPFVDLESGIESYDISVSTEGAKVSVFSKIGNITSFSIVSQYQSYVPYIVVVRAWNLAGQYSYARSGPVFIVPDKPRIISVQLATNFAGHRWDAEGAVHFEVPRIPVVMPIAMAGLGSCPSCDDIIHLAKLLDLQYFDGPVQQNVSFSVPCEFRRTDLAGTITRCSVQGFAQMDTFPAGEQWTRVEVQFKFNSILLDEVSKPRLVFLVFLARTCSGITVSASSFDFEPSYYNYLPSVSGHVKISNDIGVCSIVSNETKMLLVEWTEVFEWQGSVKLYYVALGLTEGEDDISAFRNVGESESEVFLGPFKIHGWIYATIRALNTAGDFVMSSGRILIDSTPPLAFKVSETRVSSILVDLESSEDIDGLQDIACQSSQDEIQARWDPFQDPESGIYSYRVAIVDQGAEHLLNLRYYDAGMATSLTVQCTLQLWTVYYVLVLGCNQVGLCTSARSNGVIIQQSNLSVSVLDGIGPDDSDHAASIRDMMATIQVSISGGSVEQVLCGAGSAAFVTDVQELRPVYISAVYPSTIPTVSFTSYECVIQLDKINSLRPGLWLFIVAQVVLCTGESATLSSNGSIFEPISPDIVNFEVIDNRNQRTLSQSNATAILVRWVGLILLEEEFICKVGAGHSSGSDDLISFQIANSPHEALTTQNIPPGIVWVTLECCQDDLCLQEFASVVIDVTPPTSHNISWSSASNSGCLSWATSFVAFWEPCYDPESSIVNYEYFFSEASSSNRTFKSLGLSTSIKIISADLNPGVKYCIGVRCQNSASLFSYPVVSCMTPVTSGPAVKNVSQSISHVNNAWVMESIFQIYSPCLPLVECTLESQYDSLYIASPLDLTLAGEAEMFSVHCTFLASTFLHGQVYYTSVRAQVSSFSAFATTQGCLFDSTPPIQGILSSNATLLPYSSLGVINGLQNLRLMWTEFLDYESGIEYYSVVYRAAEPFCTDNSFPCEVNFGYQSVDALGNSTFDFVFGVSLFDTRVRRYEIGVAALNGAGLSRMVSIFILIDFTPPVLGIVRDGLLPWDIDCQTANFIFSVNWMGFEDRESGIASYSWAVGTSRFGTDILDFAKYDAGLHFATRQLVQARNISNGNLVFSTIRVHFNISNSRILTASILKF